MKGYVINHLLFNKTNQIIESNYVFTVRQLIFISKTLHFSVKYPFICNNLIMIHQNLHWNVLIVDNVIPYTLDTNANMNRISHSISEKW